jgi:hypothetical protein
MPYTAKELTWLGVAKESTYGTAVTPTFFPPFKDVKPEDVIDYIKDQGIRGAMALTYNVITGIQHSTMDISTDAYPDSLGLFLLAVLGSDTVTGSASPYSHALKLARTAQPPSLTHSYYDGTSIRQFAGHIVEEVSLKWAANASLEVSVKSQGKVSTILGSAVTPTPTTTTPFAGWQFNATLGGTANLNLVGFDISLKRKLYVQHAANNSSQPSAIIAGGLEVTGKATFDKVDDTELNAFLNNTQPSFVFQGTQSGTSFGLTINMGKCAFLKDPVTAKEVVQGDVEFEAIDNTTNVGPVAITLVNGTASY